MGLRRRQARLSSTLQGILGKGNYFCLGCGLCMMAKQQIEELVRSVPFWFHSIDLGHGVVTPGMKTAGWLQRELTNLRLPILRGKSVLDINTWDGFYAFKADQREATSVTALDFYTWLT